MLIMCKNVGGLLHRADEIHAPIGLQVPDLGHLGLHLSKTRQQGKLLLSLLDMAHPSLIPNFPGTMTRP